MARVDMPAESRSATSSLRSDRERRVSPTGSRVPAVNTDSTTDWLATIAAWIAALCGLGTLLLTAGLLFAAAFAWWTARGTLLQMKHDSEAQRRDSALASRPYVHARIVPSIGGSGAWDLLVQNYGKTAAYGLRAEILAPDAKSDVISDAVRRFAGAGTFLPPGGRIRTYWLMPENPKADPPETLGFPRATVTLRYTDADGAEFSDRSVTLDSEELGITPEVYSGAKTRGSGESVDLRNVGNAVRALAINVGELSR